MAAAFFAPPAGAQGRAAPPVQVQMRKVAFHLDSTIVLDIRGLRGELRRRVADRPPLLDDKQSFTLPIDSASIGMRPSALATLLNRYTFAYPGSPSRALRMRIEHG